MCDAWCAHPIGYRSLSRGISIGIWRKLGYPDLWPVYRTLAFLRILKERETGDFSTDRRHLVLNIPLPGAAPNDRYFKDTTFHPWFGTFPKPDGRIRTTAAGKYQIVMDTWLRVIKNPGIALPTDFSIVNQVRVVTWLLLSTEGRGQNYLRNKDYRPALTLIREGGRSQIAEAVRFMADKQFTSIPKGWGQPHPRDSFSMEKMLDLFDRYIIEESLR